MLCETNRDGGGAVTSVGPAALPFARCVGGCCGRTVALQIRSRYRYGNARLCASWVDPDAHEAEGEETFHTTSTTTIVYHRFNEETEIGTCTYTIAYDDGTPLVSGSTSTPDCDYNEPVETTSPDGCTGTMYDPPATSVTADPGVTSIGGGSASRDDVRAAAIAAMAYGDWSEWTTIRVLDVYNGATSGDLSDIYLSEASLGDNGLGAGYFAASATAYESELRVFGGSPISIAVSEGPDITTAPVNRYTLTPGSSQAFDVGVPSTALGWTTDFAVLRCACPVQYAAAA